MTRPSIAEGKVGSSSAHSVSGIFVSNGISYRRLPKLNLAHVTDGNAAAIALVTVLLHSGKAVSLQKIAPFEHTIESPVHRSIMMGKIDVGFPLPSYTMIGYGTGCAR